MGQKLLASRKQKTLNEHARNIDGMDDEFEEAEFSAAHFDMRTVIQLL